jgi:hypothetical protein
VAEPERIQAPAPPVAAPAVTATELAVPQETAVGAVLSLQRTAGNRATTRALAGGWLQRDAEPAASVSITDVKLSAAAATVPASGTVQATAAPKTATGVKFKAEKDTVEPTNVTVDASSGLVTIGDKQEGGDVKITGESDDKASASTGLPLYEKPTKISATSGSAAATGARYQADFKHTFEGHSGKPAKTEGTHVDEKFDSTSAKTPFGDFDLTANAGGATSGWGVDASGQMTGPDHVSIDKSMVDARKFVKSASNPSPAAALPQGFSMTQKLFTNSLPANTQDGSPFTTDAHKRTLSDSGSSLDFTIDAGIGDPQTFDYAGPPVYRNIKASATKVVASAPKPKTGTWDRTEVTVSADVLPSGGKLAFSLVGEKLGCDIDKSSGVVKIGDKAGTIKVRASDGSAAPGHYDEVSIEITERPKETKQDAEGDEAQPSVETPVLEEPQ